MEQWFDGAPQLPSAEEVFRPGASEAEITWAEGRLGRTLPEEARASWRRHDGQWDRPYGVSGSGLGWLPGGTWLYPLRRVVEVWESQREDERRHPELSFDPELWEEPGDFDDRVRQVIWHPGRVRFAECEGAAELQLDFVPHARGCAGQVVFDVSECDFVVLASSFEGFLSRWVDLLEAGALRFDRSVGRFLPAGVERADEEFFPR